MIMKNGFTTIELVLTLVIISIISAVAYSSMPDFDMHDNAKARTDALSVIRTAQKVATAKRSTVYISIGSDQIQSCLDAACTSKLLSMDGSSIITDSYTGKYSGSVALFNFNAGGVPDTGLTIGVGTGTAITIEANTGYAH